MPDNKSLSDNIDYNGAVRNDRQKAADKSAVREMVNHQIEASTGLPVEFVRLVVETGFEESKGKKPN